jgi:predicted O-linked N-acetylglucosamine transferase (SPINDLY family)
METYESALRLKPDLPEAQNNLGNILKEGGQLDEALAAYRRAVELRPENAATGSNLIYALEFLPRRDEAEIIHEQENWNRRLGAAGQHPTFADRSGHSAERRLRVGYVSSDFRQHVIGANMWPVIRHHDHEKFEVFCYSGVIVQDALTEAFQQQADHWRSTLGVSDAALAEMIQQDRIDILLDLTQHLSGNRLPVFARTPAPVQVSFAGYPASAGVAAIPYRISDRWLEQAGESPAVPIKTSERERVFLIDSFWCYNPRDMELPVNALPAEGTGAITFGSLNNFCKVNEPLLKLWARVLKTVKDSRLVILSHEGNHRQRTVQFLARDGVDPQRIEFVSRRPHPEYLELYHRLDMVLDTFPYNGHTTSLDALWMGVPVVSLCGERPVSRAGLSQLSNLGLPELVAFTKDQYVEIAAGLANDIPHLKELRATLRPRMEKSVLMDGAHFARQIEACYHSMWREWCAENPVS